MIEDPILIVDDDDNLRAVMAEALDVLPVQITQASSGREALDLLARRRFAVIVTDLVMKDVDGIEVLEAAKESYKYGRVIILTGHGSRDVEVDAMQ